ncbi:hypothetical protein SO802_002827 [Lithocarpus litseifolius]|uniref:MRN complex-interacting protein N-terminal domain-containing protein n=1 Tax=Lithocarpus litseifolius TaxID=425828 RepID=A0AAW2E240_9ROSI
MEVEILSQVKQQQQKNKKKKISKWRCVVCNQMQSVCKVFAQGFVAKDLRGFVQSFNMSRTITEPSPLPLPQFREEEEEEEEEDIVRDNRVHNNKRRSSDWSQFLDPVEVEEEEQQVEEERDFEPKIVTELPEDLFKKQKLNANADLLYKPVFSTAKNNVISPNKDTRRYQPFAKGSSEGNDRMKQDDEGQEPRRKPQLPTAKAKRVSKWNDYIAQDDNDNLQLGSGRSFEHQLHYHTLEFETINNDQRVEDDVHPDFL